MTETLKHTALVDEHKALGAKLVPFAGYAMPVRYTSDKAEHAAVRTGCGLFDVSHMGEVFVEGPQALDCVQRLVSNDVAALAPGQALYTGMLTEQGTFIDDLIVYRWADDAFLICTNAGNRDKDTAHIQRVASDFGDGVTVRDEGDDWVQIAVQGPKAEAVCARVLGEDLSGVDAFSFRLLAHDGAEVIAARTGYTGEDGFELYTKNAHGPALWRALLGSDVCAVTPCGLGARDTLRLEAGMCLYGNDIDDTCDPYEAGLAFTVKLDKGVDFIGRAALVEKKARGVTRRLRGLRIDGKRIPRAGYDVNSTEGAAIGRVTSGTLAPHLDVPVAMAYLDKAFTKPGTTVAVDVRGQAVPAEVVKLPFYRRAKT